jgi:hypothetical protein
MAICKKGKYYFKELAIMPIKRKMAMPANRIVA